ncbi:MarR family transcriptional regulator [bacterium]|nr:MarR family transcriptional regulator [candidate division CSSED10-310 bacterium]
MKSRGEKPRKLYRNPLFLAQEWRKRMQERALSQSELAREMGVSRARVSQILNLLKLPEDVLVEVRNLGDSMERQRVTERMLR